MILDTGICTVFRKVHAEAAGYMPSDSWELIGKSWYKELSFETAPDWNTDQRQETRTDQRIRIHQMRMIRKEDRAVLADVAAIDGETTVYRITRAFHGQDDDSPTLISDLSLEEVSP